MAPSLKISTKSIVIIGLILFLLQKIVLFNQPFSQSPISYTFFNQRFQLSHEKTTSPTNLSHIVFGIVASVNTLMVKKPFIEAWWRPNVTRGYLFLERDPIKFQSLQPSLPPFRVNKKIRELKVYPKLAKPSQVRIVRTILETFRQGDRNVRWFVMADDDTVLFIDNIVDVLAKYDHTKHFYVGTNSECVQPNSNLSFDMAFGGAGIALSYSLAEALAGYIDECIERYPYLILSDLMLHTCLKDLGIDHRTHERGFHQNDLHGDISGVLSAHPQSPILSLHHIDSINPIFPSMNHSEAVNHLMKAAEIDHSRLVQQTICYQNQKRWSFSVSWGYSVHLYEDVYHRSFLTSPLETFTPWMSDFRRPLYMFKTRPVSNHSCLAPHVFLFQSVEKNRRNQVVTTYVRASQRNLPPCGGHSGDPIFKVQVFSPVTEQKQAGVMECCNVEYKTNVNVTHIKLRACMKGEVIA